MYQGKTQKYIKILWVVLVLMVVISMVIFTIAPII
jgi:hypothetical protein